MTDSKGQDITATLANISSKEDAMDKNVDYKQLVDDITNAKKTDEVMQVASHILENESKTQGGRAFTVPVVLSYIVEQVGKVCEYVSCHNVLFYSSMPLPYSTTLFSLSLPLSLSLSTGSNRRYD
jgi:hypothetical protein